MSINAHILWINDLPTDFPVYDKDWFYWVCPAGPETIKRISIVHDPQVGINIARCLCKRNITTNIYVTSNKNPIISALLSSNYIITEEMHKHLSVVVLESFTDLLDDFSTPDQFLVFWWYQSFCKHSSIVDSPFKGYDENVSQAIWNEFEIWLPHTSDYVDWTINRPLYPTEFNHSETINGDLLAIHKACPAIRFLINKNNGMSLPKGICTNSKIVPPEVIPAQREWLVWSQKVVASVTFIPSILNRWLNTTEADDSSDYSPTTNNELDLMMGGLRSDNNAAAPSQTQIIVDESSNLWEATIKMNDIPLDPNPMLLFDNTLIDFEFFSATENIIKIKFFGIPNRQVEGALVQTWIESDHYLFIDISTPR